MKANMKFAPEEWKKLTPGQKSQLRTVKGLASLPRTPYNPSISVNTTSVQPAQAVVTEIDSTQSNGSHLRQTLSNHNVRTNFRRVHKASST